MNSGKTLLTQTLVASLLALSGCTDLPSTIVTSGYDEQEMDAAIVRAQSEVDSFIAELGSPTGSDHAVKVPIENNGQVEHFWLVNVEYENGTFNGKIGNDPGIVKNVQIDQSWSVEKDQISDWMYMRAGKMHGNYTMRPLLKTMPEEEAEEIRAILSEP